MQCECKSVCECVCGCVTGQFAIIFLARIRNLVISLAESASEKAVPMALGELDSPSSWRAPASNGHQKIKWSVDWSTPHLHIAEGTRWNRSRYDLKKPWPDINCVVQ